MHVDTNTSLELRLGGFAMMLAGAGYFIANVPRDPSAVVPSSAKSIAFVGIVGGLAVEIAGFVYGRKAFADRTAAYRAFRHDLAARLSVCIAGYAVVACEATPAQLPAPPPVPQPIP